MRDDFGGLVQAGDVGGKDGNARLIRFLNGGSNRAGVAGTEDDGIDEGDETDLEDKAF